MAAKEAIGQSRMVGIRLLAVLVEQTPIKRTGQVSQTHLDSENRVSQM